MSQAVDFLKNKHVVVALIVAPILAIASYFAVDAAVSEKPHAAVQGSSYALAEKPNCRYSSGVCGLKNAEFELKFTTEWRADNNMRLLLSSVHALDGIKVAMVEGDDPNVTPQDMLQVDDTGLLWELEVPRPDPELHRLQVAASYDHILYFGDAAMTFSYYETSFKKDFRQ